MTKTKTADKTRRTLDDFPAVQEANEKLAALQDQRRELQRVIDAEAQRLEKIKKESRVPVDRTTVAALQLLDATVADDPPLDTVALNTELGVLTRAIEIQQERLDKAKLAAQQESRGDYLDLHKQIRAALLAAGEQLAAAARDELQFRLMLEAENIGFGFPLEPISHPKLFGRLGHGEQGMLDAWLDELRGTYAR